MTQTKQEINETLLYQYVAKLPPSLSTARFDEFYPVPDEAAIDAGVFTRYFIRQANHRAGYITEIDSSTYNEFRSNKMYKVIELPWRIKGQLDDVFGPQDGNTPVRTYTGVKTANALTLKEAEKEMPGITRQLGNLIQFWVGQ